MSSKVRLSKPIGVFDSGLGGLTVVREMRRVLPHENILYFGDIARLPYGTKSNSQIRRFSEQNIRFLQKKSVKAVVVACNSSSSAAYAQVKRLSKVPVVDVIRPVTKEAIQQSNKGRIGVIATKATIESGAYQGLLTRSRSRKVRVFTQACPLFVPLVEEGLWNDPITSMIADRYLYGLIKNKIDTLVLGCTHYPMLKKMIRKIIPENIQIIDSAEPTVVELIKTLQSNSLISSSGKRGRMDICLSDKPRNFKTLGEQFLGEKIARVQEVAL